jgi:hypothetical protein
MAGNTAGFSLIHPCGLHIHKDVREQEVGVAPGVTTRDHRNGYVWYYLPRAQIADQAIWMGLCFFKHRLEFIHIGVVDAPDQSGWDAWSQLKEEARADAVGRWLAQLGYPVGSYSWGVVHAGIDPKTGDGSGIVRFVQDTTT